VYWCVKCDHFIGKGEIVDGERTHGRSVRPSGDAPEPPYGLISFQLVVMIAPFQKSGDERLICRRRGPLLAMPRDLTSLKMEAVIGAGQGRRRQGGIGSAREGEKDVLETMQ